MQTSLGLGVSHGDHRHIYKVSHRLNAQTAGDHRHKLGAFRDLQRLFRQGTVAQKVKTTATGDGLAHCLTQSHELLCFRLADVCEFLEALVAGYNINIVFAHQKLP